MASILDYAAPAGFGSSSLTFALQALLHRHESYMAEAEEDRRRLMDSIDALEREKQEVQAENARIVNENRNLLGQLEGLNKAVSDSDDHINSLAVTLESTQKSLSLAAARTAELEIQLAMMETEQSKLQESLVSAHDDEKSAVQRWRKAENTLRDLYGQVDRIEKEAREERERHEEVVQRMERKRAVERELDSAAGRLKAAAAASDLGRHPESTHVVSRFVKDILQDNANLQVGIMELREMLESSNQEVQNLREQVLSHQPLAGIGEEDDQSANRAPTTLSEELEAKENERRVSQEFHIHHHYHTPKKDRGSLNRRVKKKRPALGSPGLHSAVGPQSPRRPAHRSQSSGSSMSTILSQTSVSIPPAHSRGWSLQSAAADSTASSPQSAYPTSSIFDRVDRGFDSSQPTSPDSTVFSSPLMGARPVKGDTSFRAFGGFDDPVDDSFACGEDRLILEHGDGVARQPAIPEEAEDSTSPPYPASDYPAGDYHPADAYHADEEVFDMQMDFQPLRRDSLLSVAGMDIHTPNHHSQMGEWHPGMRIPRRIVSPSVVASTPPVISAPTVTIDRGKSSEQSPRSLLASVAACNHVPPNHAPETSSIISDSTSTSSTLTRRSLGLRMGGWVLGRWGMAAVSSDYHSAEADTSTASLATSSPSTIFPAIPKRPSAPALRFRFPGVNQKGPIMGLRPPPQAPVSVHAIGVDENLLRESLVEDAS